MRDQLNADETWYSAQFLLAPLERLRSDRIGPVFLEILGRVLYRHVDIEAFEVASMKAAFVGHSNGPRSMGSTRPELAKASADNAKSNRFPIETRDFKAPAI